MTALPCDDLAAVLAKAAVPVLILDTCTILDVVRAPIREQLGTHDIGAVHTLLARATAASPAVSFVITAQVLQEFQDNIHQVETDTHNALASAAARFAAILERIQALSPGDSIPRAVDLSSLGFPRRARHLATQIVQASSVLTDHPDDIVRAYRRVTLAKPPATKARQSVKDCLIAENTLRLAATLRSIGFFQNIVFATSNTKDYQQDHRSLHPELRAEFIAVSLEYAPNWSAARHDLDAPHASSPSPG